MFIVKDSLGYEEWMWCDFWMDYKGTRKWIRHSLSGYQTCHSQGQKNNLEFQMATGVPKVLSFIAGRYREHLVNWREHSSWHYHQDDSYFFDMS